jgi:uncharacterized protein YybS (DUF2232 family)
MGLSKTLRDGAGATIFFILLLVLTIYVPIMGWVSLFLLPLPLTFFTNRAGWKTGLGVFISSFLLATFVTPRFAYVIIAGFLLIGLVMGELLRRKGTAFSLLLGGALSNVVILLIGYGIASDFYHINIISWLTSDLIKNYELTLKMYPYVYGDSKDQLNTIRQAIASLGQLTPAFLVIIAFFYAFLIELVSGFILKKLSVPFPKWPPIREWRFPRNVIWFYFLAVIIMLAGGTNLEDTIEMVAFNVVVLLEWVLAIQGFSFVFFYFHQKKKRRFIPILITIFSLLIPPVLYIVRLLGIIDLGFDFRSRITRK